ncbi:Probable cytochrome P450 9f2 [Camponotus floridanus]|uniref:Probable cytochrome P450 9f2 n=1 Tax=Camponotus floridanus TaxID=104421 RepID=E2A2J4_CAMFO|nr:Probable cytochrome P450 9f2 [Camponotus floridanus]
MCIGNRFALLEAKVVIFYLLARCELKPCAKTCHPLRLSKKNFAMLAEGGFWLKVQARNDVHTSVSTSVNGTVINGHI